MNDDVPGALVSHEETVRPEWVDYNGHMNVAYYVLVFDHGTDAFLDHAGLGQDYREGTGHSVFVVEAHVTYEGEVGDGERLRVATRLLGHDAKRLHLFHEMHRLGDGRPVATNELMFVHVDLRTRRAVPFPEAARTRIGSLERAHAALPRPAKAGRAIGLGPKPPGP
ncbi:MAG: thioesterase family protein [Rhodospirillales bacterium]